ncbi:M48 family metalloprotease [Pontivivens ytuae]|uniref:M48 family metalloprotease n=1 Tax=Pontivivens ytuae TaxID=2789856 RepID=A0A7S9LQ18_9RHOB|nr:M48 family metalloprotease [Pontivivens ytuae]QPH53128.1 M48 family metalloprotease [Pontivivens ytuae]
MITLGPILIAVIAGLVMWRFSAWNLARQLDATSRPLRDPVIGQYVDRMARALDLPKLTVHVQDSPVINGLAAPDGRIFITRGFIDKYKLGEVQAEEIASVIAHELGHVALGHSRRRLLDFSGQNAIRMVLVMVLGRLIPFVGIWIANLVTQALAARLSRQDEYEADAYAAALLTKIELGIGPQRSLFRKLDRLAGGANGTPAWLMSHPKAEERIAAIETLARGWTQRPALN